MHFREFVTLFFEAFLLKLTVEASVNRLSDKPRNTEIVIPSFRNITNSSLLEDLQKAKHMVPVCIFKRNYKGGLSCIINRPLNIKYRELKRLLELLFGQKVTLYDQVLEFHYIITHVKGIPTTRPLTTSAPKLISMKKLVLSTLRLESEKNSTSPPNNSLVSDFQETNCTSMQAKTTPMVSKWANHSQETLVCKFQYNCTERVLTVRNDLNQEIMNKTRKISTLLGRSSMKAIELACLSEIKINCSGKWLLLDRESFRFLENNSILVNVTNKIYHWSEYVLENYSSVWICDKKVSNGLPVGNKDNIFPTSTVVCMSLSIVSLVFVLITYSLFSELRTLPGINVMNFSTSLLLAQFLWLVGSKHIEDSMACVIIAVLLHYFFLVSFVWASIIAFDTWRAFTSKRLRTLADSKYKRLKPALQYMTVGWLSVMVYVAICMALDQSDTVLIGYGSRDVCWISGNNAKFYFFGIPVGLLIIFNIVFFSMTAKAIKVTRNQTRIIADQSERKRQFGVYVRIASLMGFTWVIGFAAPFGWLSEILVYAFVVLNSLQGVYIAIAFTLNKRTRKLYRDLLRGKRQLSNYTNKTETTKVKTSAGSTTLEQSGILKMATKV